MANRSRKKRPRGPGTAQRRKERELGIENVDGLSKPMLDKLHVESGRLFGLGIGVLLREESVARSTMQGHRDKPWFKRWLPGSLLAYRKAKAEHALWDGRLAECASAVARKHAP